MIRPRLVGAADLPLLDAGLRALAADLGDPYRLSSAQLAQMLFGPRPHLWAVVADDPEATGLALFTPLVSTSFGTPGAFVSDLWVGRAHRGAGLGRALLVGVLHEARALWGAGYLRLAVYSENNGARGFYAKLGFVTPDRERAMILPPEAAQSLMET